MTDRKTVLVVSTIASFMTPFMSSSVTIALPRIGKEFAMNAVDLGWVASSFLLAAVMVLLPMGRLADIHGRKRIFLLGIGVHTLASLAVTLVQSELALILARAVQGLGGGMIFGTGVAMLVSAYPPAERGRALGINVAGVYLGLSLGPVIGGFMTAHLGWRSVFLTAAALGLPVVLLVLRNIREEWAEAQGEKFDTPGALLSAVSLLLIMYGFSILPDGRGAWMLAAGLGGLTLFFFRESRASAPLLHVELFRGNAVFAYSNLAALINYSATFAVTFLMSLYLQYIKGYTPQDAGAILVIQPLVMTVFSPLAGRWSDRIEPRILASTGMGILAVGLGCAALIGEETGTPIIGCILILLGFGFALFSSPNTNAVMSSVEKKHFSVASAALGTMRLAGQMLSMGVVMLLFALHIGKEQMSPAKYPAFLVSFRTLFVIFALLSLVGVFFSLARGSMHEKS